VQIYVNHPVAFSILDLLDFACL